MADSHEKVLGTCGPYGSLGEACTGLQQCALGLYCDTASGTCSERPGLGEVCDDFGDAYCFGAGVACLTSGASNGICGPSAALGETCSPSCPSVGECVIDTEAPYQPCAPGLECVDGLCNATPASDCPPG